MANCIFPKVEKKLLLVGSILNITQTIFLPGTVCTRIHAYSLIGRYLLPACSFYLWCNFCWLFCECLTKEPKPFRVENMTTKDSNDETHSMNCYLTFHSWTIHCLANAACCMILYIIDKWFGGRCFQSAHKYLYLLIRIVCYLRNMQFLYHLRVRVCAFHNKCNFVLVVLWCFIQFQHICYSCISRRSLWFQH